MDLSQIFSLIKCTQCVSIFILLWHPYTSSSESQWQSFILASFLSFSSYPTKNTLSLPLRTGLRASSEGLFHLLLKYWSARGTHTHTFIRRHTVRLTPDQSHWQSKPHFIQKERESINESMMIMILYSVILITISSIGSWNYTENI